MLQSKDQDRDTRSNFLRRERDKSQETSHRKRRVKESAYCRRLREGFEMIESEESDDE